MVGRAGQEGIGWKPDRRRQPGTPKRAARISRRTSSWIRPLLITAVVALLAAKGRGRQSPPPVLIPGAETMPGLATEIPEVAEFVIAPQLERALQDAGLKTSDSGLQFTTGGQQ